MSLAEPLASNLGPFQEFHEGRLQLAVNVDAAMGGAGPETRASVYAKGYIDFVVGDPKEVLDGTDYFNDDNRRIRDLVEEVWEKHGNPTEKEPPASDFWDKVKELNGKRIAIGKKVTDEQFQKLASIAKNVDNEILQAAMLDELESLYVTHQVSMYQAHGITLPNTQDLALKSLRKGDVPFDYLNMFTLLAGVDATPLIPTKDEMERQKTKVINGLMGLLVKKDDAKSLSQWIDNFYEGLGLGVVEGEEILDVYTKASSDLFELIKNDYGGMIPDDMEWKVERAAKGTGSGASFQYMCDDGQVYALSQMTLDQPVNVAELVDNAPHELNHLITALLCAQFGVKYNVPAFRVGTMTGSNKVMVDEKFGLLGIPMHKHRLLSVFPEINNVNNLNLMFENQKLAMMVLPYAGSMVETGQITESSRYRDINLEYGVSIGRADRRTDIQFDPPTQAIATPRFIGTLYTGTLYAYQGYKASEAALAYGEKALLGAVCSDCFGPASVSTFAPIVKIMAEAEAST